MPTQELKLGETLRSEKTPGGKYNIMTDSLEPETKNVTLRKECRDTILTHTDISVEMVAGEVTPEENVAGENQELQTALVSNDDGTTDKQTVTTTHRPRTKVLTWSDDYYNYECCSYVNQPEPLKPAAGDKISCSFSINHHGTYNGSYTVANVRTTSGESGSTQTLQWSKDSTVRGDYYYLKADGTLWKRTFTANVSYYYGRTNAVIDKVADGEDCAHVGWKSGWTGNHEYARGVKYYNIQCGGEHLVA